MTNLSRYLLFPQDLEFDATVGWTCPDCNYLVGVGRGLLAAYRNGAMNITCPRCRAGFHFLRQMPN